MTGGGSTTIRALADHALACRLTRPTGRMVIFCASFTARGWRLIAAAPRRAATAAHSSCQQAYAPRFGPDSRCSTPARTSTRGGAQRRRGPLFGRGQATFTNSGNNGRHEAAPSDSAWSLAGVRVPQAVAGRHRLAARLAGDAAGTAADGDRLPERHTPARSGTGSTTRGWATAAPRPDRLAEDLPAGGPVGGQASASQAR